MQQDIFNRKFEKILRPLSGFAPAHPTRPTPEWVPKTEIPICYILYIYIYFFNIRQRTCYIIDDYSLFRVIFQISIQSLTSAAAPIHM